MTPQAVDRFSAEVWSLGTLGLELSEPEPGSVVAAVYFCLPPTCEVRELAAGQRTIPGARLLGADEVASRNWQADQRRRARRIALGRRWLVDPREPGGPPEAEAGDRRLLRIPARTAFGTGSHESTALLAELLEETAVAGRRVLDVGTGSGILAMMALGRGARWVLGIDSDSSAVVVARANVLLNRLEVRLAAASLEALRVPAHPAAFHLAMANLLPHELRPELPRLVRCLQPAAEVLVSGLLRHQEGAVLAELAGHGLRYRRRRERCDWVALHLELARP